MERPQSIIVPVHRYLVLLWLVMGHTAMPSTLQAAVDFRTVLLSGQQAPGTPADTVFGNSFGGFAFATFLLNDQGQIAFVGHLLEGTGDTTSSNRSGVWRRDSDGQVRLVARAGDPAPGVPGGEVYSGFGSLRFNDAGQVLFRSNSGFWLERPGGFALIAREGEQAPGAPEGAVFESFSSQGPSLNNSGQVAFSALLEPFQAGVTFDNWNGVWFDDGSGLSLIARQADPAPALPPGVHFQELGFRLGESGQVLIFSELYDADGPHDTGIWLFGPSGPQLLNLQSDPVPGEPATTSFWSVGASFANAGQLTHTAIVRREGVLDHSVWLVTPTGLSPLIQDGADAPGLPTGSVFDLKIGSIQQFRMRSTDLIAFHATYSPATLGSNRGIWAGDPDDLSLIALASDHAPGTPDNVIFFDFSRLTINAHGDVVFIGELFKFSGAVDSSNDFGLWAAGPDGELRLLIREGDLFEVLPGDIRTVAGFHAGGSDSMLQLNDAGVLAIGLLFTDGTSGLFTAVIPEPGTLNCLDSVRGRDRKATKKAT